MNNLYEILANAQNGDAMIALGRKFGLTPDQTQAAVAALLPAISLGLKQSTVTPEGLGNLFGVMGAQQQNLKEMYEDPKTAFRREGRAAGDEVLSSIFGSPDVSRAVAEQGQHFSGVTSGVLKQMLPILAGILVSGLTRAGSGTAASPVQPGSPTEGGGLGDILGQIFGRGLPGSSGSSSGTGQSVPVPSGQPIPVPTDAGGQAGPAGDLLGQILREFEKGIREGRIKPVIIGGRPVQMPVPGGQAGPSSSGPNPPQIPGGDVLGQVLRDIFGGAIGGPAQVPQGRQGQSPQLKDLSEMSRQLGVMSGVGAAVFGDRFEVGRDIEQGHVDNIQGIFDRYFGAQRR